MTDDYWMFMLLNEVLFSYSVFLHAKLIVCCFSRELFNKWQAQRWWAENYDKVMELYNVQKFNQQGVPSGTPSRSEDEVRVRRHYLYLFKTEFYKPSIGMRYLIGNILVIVKELTQLKA